MGGEVMGVPGGYDSMGYATLQKICRDRGLPATGVKPVLVSRLVDNDRRKSMADPPTPDDMVRVTWEEPPAGVSEVPERSGLPTGPIKIDEQQDLQTEGYEPHTRVYFVMHPSPTLPTDSEHQELLRRTVERATAAGYKVRGGLYAGRRSSVVAHGDEIYMCYEVSVRSPQ